MTATTHTSAPSPTPNPEKAITLALCLAHAENALRTFTTGQVDAIIDPDGKPYLLRPAQEHLRKSERRLQAIIDSTADVITVLNRSGMIPFSKPVRETGARLRCGRVGGQQFLRLHSRGRFARYAFRVFRRH